MCDLISEALTTSERRVVFKTSADEALKALKEEDFDVVVTDLNMAGMTGTDLCRRLVASCPDVPAWS